MKLPFEDDAVEGQEKTIELFLGCGNGFVYKYEKVGDKDWVLAGKFQGVATVTDVLQTGQDTLIIVQDGGYFNFLDPNTCYSRAHLQLSGLSKSSKTRLTQRGGHLAVADDNGLFFVKHGIGGANTPTVSSLDEKYLKGKMVTDFIEYERDKFFVSVLKDDFFYLVTRFGDEKQMLKIRSMNSNYISMGLQPLPRADQTFIVVRDNHGVQLMNLETLKSH